MEDIHNDISNYYTEKITTHGATPKGVDWNGEEGQVIRFEQISKVIASDDFSVNDLGCGYGKYLSFLGMHYENYKYKGYDLSQEMIKFAKSEYPGGDFSIIDTPDQIYVADYTVASGIFSVRMNFTESDWLSYVSKTLDAMSEKSLKGFSFNMLTKYSDKEFMRDDLYYADPMFFFDYCKKKYSRNVAVLHDYGLYEFTIIVKK